MLRIFLVSIAILSIPVIIASQSTHPLALALRYRLGNWIAEKPSVNLSFRRIPHDRPVIEAGQSNRPMLVMDPFVLTDEEGLHLFYSSVFIPTREGMTQVWTPDRGEQFNISKLTTGIGYAYSEDHGLTWTIREQPLIRPSKNEWDDYRVETASAVIRGDTLHVFYCGDCQRSVGRYQIGAVSVPLKNQSIRESLLHSKEPIARQRSTPAIRSNFEKTCFHNNLQEPSILLHDDGFEVYFVGLQMSLPKQALADEGQQLQRIGMGRALLSETFDVREITDEPVLEFANIIEVRRLDEGLIAFVTLSGEGDAHQGERIGYHTSQDGVSWSQSKSVLFPRAESFDNWGCMSPTAIREGDHWILFYAALKHDTHRKAETWAMSLGEDGWLSGSLGRAEASLKVN